MKKQILERLNFRMVARSLFADDSHLSIRGVVGLDYRLG